MPFLLFILISCRAFSQIDSIPAPCFTTSAHAHAGNLIRIHGEYPEHEIASAAEFNFAWKATGRRKWHNSHQHASLGFSIVALNFGNPDTLGNAFGAIPTFIREYTIGKGSLFIRAGLGLAWFSKPYHPTDNPGNLVIGSRIANLTQIHAGYFLPLGSHLAAGVGLSYMHASNAHIKVPNIGANVVSLSAGLKWSFCKNNSILSPNQNTPFIRRNWRPSVTFGLGLHEAQGTIRPLLGGIYSVLQLSPQISRLSASGNGRISAGVIVSYHRFYHEYILTQELISADDAFSRSLVVNCFLGREWIFGKFGLFLQGGINVYAPFQKELDKIWDLPKLGWLGRTTGNRFGYHYYPLGYEKNKQMPFLGMAVKASGGTAEYLEFTAGFIF